MFPSRSIHTDGIRAGVMVGELFPSVFQNLKFRSLLLVLVKLAASLSLSILATSLLHWTLLPIALTGLGTRSVIRRPTKL